MWGSFVNVIVAMGTLGLVVVQAQAEPSLNEVLRDFNNPESTNAQRQTISSNLAGIELGLGWANTAMRAQGQTRFYCLPDRQDTPSAELLDILRGALAAEPRLGDQPI